MPLSHIDRRIIRSKMVLNKLDKKEAAFENLSEKILDPIIGLIE